MAEFDGRRVVITGGARGIGLAAARAFAAAGAQTLIADIDGDEIKTAAQQFGAKWVRADASSARGAAKIAAKAKRDLGGIDIFVNNAAVFLPPIPFAEMTVSQWDRVLKTNLSGAYHCVRAALPHLKESNGASIVNIASTQGIAGQPESSAYCTAKGGIISFTRALAVDLAPHRIRVNAVAPGFIDTRMAVMADGRHEHKDAFFRKFYIGRRRIPLARAGKPDDVAGAILFFAGDGSGYVTGQTLAVDGGLLATY